MSGEWVSGGEWERVSGRVSEWGEWVSGGERGSE